jgi:hypothetical protein
MNAELYLEVLKVVGNMDGSRSAHFIAEQKLIALAPRCREELEKPQECVWKQESGSAGWMTTGCNSTGKQAQLYDHKYCPWCGKPIRVEEEENHEQAR